MERIIHTNQVTFRCPICMQSAEGEWVELQKVKVASHWRTYGCSNIPGKTCEFSDHTFIPGLLDPEVVQLDLIVKVLVECPKNCDCKYLLLSWKELSQYGDSAPTHACFWKVKSHLIFNQMPIKIEPMPPPTDQLFYTNYVYGA